jgi:hypothetical protein
MENELKKSYEAVARMLLRSNSMVGKICTAASDNPSASIATGDRYDERDILAERISTSAYTPVSRSA